jgi:hypothetical protein
MTCQCRVRQHLHDEGGDDAVRVDEARDTEVLDALLAEDLLAGLEPHHVVGALQELRHHAACGATRQE